MGHRDPYFLKNYIIINWPQGIDLHKLFFTTVELETIRENMNNFVFVARGNNDKEVAVKRKETTEALKVVFGRQRLGDTNINLHNYNILNWPINVSKMSERWSMFDCEEIQASLHKIVFLPMKIPNIPLHSNLKKLNLMRNIVLNKNWKLEDVYFMLLERFKAETGISNCQSIDWRFLDYTTIPERYVNIPLNSRTLVWNKVFQNAELIDNIHFCARINY